MPRGHLSAVKFNAQHRAIQLISVQGVPVAIFFVVVVAVDGLDGLDGADGVPYRVDFSRGTVGWRCQI